MFLSTRPLWISVVLLGLATMAFMYGPVIVRRRVGLHKLTTNNEIAGFKFATVGVLYAVMLGFAIIVVWEKFSDAEMHVTEEAGAAATVYRLVDGINSDAGPALRKGMTHYLQVAVAEDWPAMTHGEGSPAVTQALNRLYTAVLLYRPSDGHGTVVFREILYQLDRVTEARRSRLFMAAGIVPGVIWIVLFGGAFVTIGFTFFFGTANLRAQVMMTGALSLLIFCGLLIIIAIDHPFAGTVTVGPEPLSTVLHDFGEQPRT